MKNFDYAISTLRIERASQQGLADRCRDGRIASPPIALACKDSLDELDRAIALLTDVAAARLPV
jgi:hypothetical protein